MNLVTPKAGAKHELLFNEPASGFLRTAISKGIMKIILFLNAIIESGGKIRIMEVLTTLHSLSEGYSI